MEILSERGYMVVAANTDTDYVGCARRLAASVKHWHPDAKLCLLSDQLHDAPEFDYQKQFPFGDQCRNQTWKLANDWQVGTASPFRQTIKLEADMLICGPIDHWWAQLQHLDVCISTGARNFYNEPAESRFYRKVFDVNGLPDVYNAIVYWRLSKTAHEFWQWVKTIFQRWDKYRSLLKFPDDEPTTDLVYAMAAQIMGPERVTQPWATYPKIVHMKKHMIPTYNSDWTKELIWEMDDNCLRIQTVAQWGAFHYHHKHWTPYGSDH